MPYLTLRHHNFFSPQLVLSNLFSTRGGSSVRVKVRAAIIPRALQSGYLVHPCVARISPPL